MKKLLIFLILSFFPWRGEAIVCDPPLVCIKKESQVCIEQNMIHLGDDDCVECGCPKGLKKRIDSRGKVCCEEEPGITCEPSKGVILTDELFGGCFCGCETDDDCNTDLKNKTFIKKRRACKNDNQCGPLLACYTLDNLTIELEERDDSELKPEHLPALAAKLKPKLELAPNEHVKLAINSYECTHKGGVAPGDRIKIRVNINACCEISEGEWTCEGTVVHENEHRQDNYKQPIWNKDLKSTIAKAFANILTETNAHAKGDIEKMTQRYRVCYPEKNNFQNICKTAPESDQCKKCSHTYVPSYLEDFDNPEYAKKYHDDPDYFDPDGGCKGQSYNTCQCRGIRLEFERKYINSTFARGTYIAGQAVESTMCGEFSDAEEAAQKDLRNIIEALAECEGWEKSPEEDLTDLPKLIAQLYKEKNELCMSAEEIASNVNIAQGLEGLQTCSVIKDFLAANANVDLNNLPTTCEEKCEEVTLTSD